MFLNFSIALFIWLIKAKNRFAYFFLKVTEKSFYNCNHFGFSFSNSFFKLLLFFNFNRLMLFDILKVAV